MDNYRPVSILPVVSKNFERIMQKQIMDLSTSAHMGIGGLKVALFIGALLGGLYTFMKFLK